MGKTFDNFSLSGSLFSLTRRSQYWRRRKKIGFFLKGTPRIRQVRGRQAALSPLSGQCVAFFSAPVFALERFADLWYGPGALIYSFVKTG
jgi:hypothetical protein